jgi:hypothetical protein
MKLAAAWITFGLFLTFGVFCGFMSVWAFADETTRLDLLWLIPASVSLIVALVCLWLASDFFWSWQFDVDVSAVVSDFDKNCKVDDHFSIWCPSQEVATEFRRLRRQSIEGFQNFDPTKRRVGGIKVSKHPDAVSA